jgi:large subunit ribosomal protein L22
MNFKHTPKLKTLSRRALKQQKERSKAYSSKATARMIRMSPLKVRRVMKQIVGCSYEEALILLRFLPYRACHPIAKLLKSAGSNLIKNNFVPESYLQVYEGYVDKGPILKRIRPRAKGRAYPIKKYTSHISISVRSTFSKYENNFDNDFIAYSIDEKMSKWKINKNS